MPREIKVPEAMEMQLIDQQGYPAGKGNFFWMQLMQIINDVLRTKSATEIFDFADTYAKIKKQENGLELVVTEAEYQKMLSWVKEKKGGWIGSKVVELVPPFKLAWDNAEKIEESQ